MKARAAWVSMLSLALAAAPARADEGVSDAAPSNGEAERAVPERAVPEPASRAAASEPTNSPPPVRGPTAQTRRELAQAAAPALVRDEARVEWNPEWPRFRLAEVIATVLLGAQAATAAFLYPVPPRRVRGGILFDDAVRDALVPSSRDTREGLRPFSDNLYLGMIAYPILVDALIVAGGVHGAPDVALELLAMNLQSFALTGALVLTAQKLGRERPAARGCADDPDYHQKCGSDKGLSESFFSGHAAITFTSAGLTCVHHQHLPLYGGNFADVAICGLSIAAASTESVMRIMTEDHYTTDVLFGIGVGVFSGYVLPSLLHYGFANAPRAQGEQSSPLRSSTRLAGAPLELLVAPALTPGYAGVAVVGAY